MSKSSKFPLIFKIMKVKQTYNYEKAYVMQLYFSIGFNSIGNQLTEKLTKVRQFVLLFNQKTYMYFNYTYLYLYYNIRDRYQFII